MSDKLGERVAAALADMGLVNREGVKLAITFNTTDEIRQFILAMWAIERARILAIIEAGKWLPNVGKDRPLDGYDLLDAIADLKSMIESQP